MFDYQSIQLRRLKSYRGTQFAWDNHTVTLKDIKHSLKEGLSEVNEVYANYDSFEPNPKSKEWHIGRIIYFIKHPEEIDPIYIDNKCGNYGNVYAIPIIDDGNHRYMALTYLNPKWIKVNYSGRHDLLNYLSGKSNEIPM